LAPITDDGNFFPFQMVEVSILVVIDFHSLLLFVR
jgi:hypothetical protein